MVAGKHARHTENTVAALEAAHRAGAPAVEVDLVVTADRQPLVMHDATLSRRRVRALHLHGVDYLRWRRR